MFPAQKIRVTVTKHDIAVGVRKHPDRCPVARALRRAIKEQGAQAHADKTPKNAAPLMPAVVWSFVKLFDDPATSRKLLRPFSFTFTLPEVK